jgi:hypothetical protein
MQIVLTYYSNYVCLLTAKPSNHPGNACILLYCQGEEMKKEREKREMMKKGEVRKTQLTVCWITEEPIYEGVSGSGGISQPFLTSALDGGEW